MKTLAIGVALLALTFIPSLHAAEEVYKIDPVHSTMSFKVRHLGISYVTGRFDKFEGTVKFDPDAPEKSVVDISVDASSVNTANNDRDKHLRNEDFFVVDKHPALTFKSTAVKKLDDGSYEVTGDFTLLGVTKPLTVKVNDSGLVDGPQGQKRRGSETEFTIDRTTFGMDYGKAMIGTDVKVSLAFSAIKQ